MARNPFEETARSGGRPGYQSPTNYRGESPQFSRGNLDVRYPVDSAVQQAHNRPSNRQPLLNQPPMEGPPQRPHVNPRMSHINPRGMGGGLGGMQEQAGLWQDIKRILKNTRNPGHLIDQWTDHWMKSQRMAGNDTGIGSTDEYQMAKVYGSGDEGMQYDSWGGWGKTVLSDEANAINQALQFSRDPNAKVLQGFQPSTLRGALGNKLYENNPEFYRGMLPPDIRNQLPEDAFETQSDWLNQQPITVV